MFYSALADALLWVHLSFVLFVVFGGLLALKWPGVIWWHLPAVLWGAVVEFTGWICPLTPLERQLRGLAAPNGAESDFLARYVRLVLYPESLTYDIQVVLGTSLIAMNVFIYGLVWRRWRGAAVAPRLTSRGLLNRRDGDRATGSDPPPAAR